MAQDGRQLEGLVAFVERLLLPQGFEVRTNERIFDEDGIQIAEFDINIRGKIGSTEIAWLIECRDRPAGGPAPSSWIEQLVGRRTRFAFNKVTAVSTTGFTPGAKQFASSQGIELREVRSLEPDAFDWLHVRSLRLVTRVASLLHANLLSRDGDGAAQSALQKVLSNQPGDPPFLRSIKTGKSVTAAVAFCNAVTQGGTLFDGLEPNGPGKNIELNVEYAGVDDYFVVDTQAGDVRISAIQYYGTLSIQETLIPLMGTAEYRQSASGGTISQVVSFAPQNLAGIHFSMELHRMPESGLTHVILRKLANDD